MAKNKMIAHLCGWIGLASLIPLISADSCVVNAFAGTGGSGFSGDGGKGTSAEINRPEGVWVTTTQDNLLIGAGARVRRQSLTTDIIDTYAGSGVYLGIDWKPGDGLPATDSMVRAYPNGICGDTAGNVFLADRINNRIRIVTTDNIISTIAGYQTGAENGEGGPATSANFPYPWACAVDSTANVYLTVSVNAGSVKKIDRSSGILTNYINGPADVFGGTRTSTYLNQAYGLFIDSTSRLYVGDKFRVFRTAIDGSDAVTLFTGGLAGFTYGDGGAASSAYLGGIVHNLAGDSRGNIFVSNDMAVRYVKGSTGIIDTMAGNSASGPATGNGGAATSANFVGDLALYADEDDIYVASTTHNNVRKLSCVFFEETSKPSGAPTVAPSALPTVAPTVVPSSTPSVVPSALPTVAPTTVPTSTPTMVPSAMPTTTPSVVPSAVPSVVPTLSPTSLTASPSVKVTNKPTVTPTRSFRPTRQPTLKPTFKPTPSPTTTKVPVALPPGKSYRPTRYPTFKPTFKPTLSPTVIPVPGVLINANLTMDDVHMEQGGGRRRLAKAGSNLLLDATDNAIIKAVAEALGYPENAVTIESEHIVSSVDNVATVLVELKILAPKGDFSTYEAVFAEFQQKLSDALAFGALTDRIKAVADELGAYELYQISATSVTGVSNEGAVNTQVGANEEDGDDLATGYFAGVVIGVIVGAALLVVLFYLLCGAALRGDGAAKAPSPAPATQQQKQPQEEHPMSNPSSQVEVCFQKETHDVADLTTVNNNV